MIVRAQQPRIATSLIAALAAITLLRWAIGAPSAAASSSAAAAAATGLLVVAFSAGWRPSRLRPVGLIVGGGVGCALAALPHLQPGSLLVWSRPNSTLLFWTLLVSAIAVSEELVLRGCLIDAVVSQFRGSTGLLIGVLGAALVFALIHVPLYGIRAVPVDFGVGVVFGCLRVEFGLGAAIAAHVVADLAAGWLI